MWSGRRPQVVPVRFPGEWTNDFTGLTFRRYEAAGGGWAGVGTVRSFIDPTPKTNQECRPEAVTRLARHR